MTYYLEKKMLQQYSIADILSLPSQHIPYYIGTFEGTEDPDIQWPHRHDYYSLVWFTSGKGFYVVDFEEYELCPDRIFLVNPGQIHNWNYSHDSRGYILTVDQTLGAELNLHYYFPFIDIHGEVKALLEKLFPQLITDFQPAYDVRIDIRYVHQLINRFANRNHPIHRTATPQLEKFNRLILEECLLLQSVDDYASHLAISPDELNALCKQQAGISAKQYILDKKLTEAKRLLLYSQMNMNEIAYQLGFEDSSYFARIFRKKTSLTPSGFLKKYRKEG